MSNEPSHAANFDENDYARPNQSWSCGWAAEGHACPLGPARMGVCRSAHECAPYREGDTWFCARIKAKGGPCDEGPLPSGACCRPVQKCQPVRSIMSRRGVVSLSVFAAAVGVALIMLAAPGRSRLISPGPLISAHRQVVDHCEDCHDAGGGQLSDWVDEALVFRSDDRQSTRCLQCHVELGDHALHPHGQATDTLKALTSQHAEQSAEQSGEHRRLQVVVAKTILGSPSAGHAALACATCHREHHGTAALTALTNEQCQVCHATDFHSFGNGHPALVDYPYRRRTRIYFDHQTHFGKHFPAPDGESRHACRDCHTPDSAGRYMLAGSFAATCAKCHARQIEDEASPGLLVAAIPAVDVQSLPTAGVEFGQWPAVYPLHVEARAAVAPFYLLISPRREDLRSAQARLAEVDLADLSQATAEQRTRVESFLWTFKESLVDMLDKGRPGLRADFAARFKTHLSDEQIDGLVGVVPLDGLAAMQQQWLAGVEEELDARRAGAALPDREPDDVQASAPETDAVQADDLYRSRLLGSGWQLHSPSMSLRYRPTRHADPLMKTLLDFCVSATAATSASAADESANATSAAALGAFYKSLASPFAPGRCLKCHSVDHDAPGGARVNWLSYQPLPERHAFTRFSHAPHLTFQTNEACSRCHNLAQGDAASDTILRPEFVGQDWQPRTSLHNFQSDFAQMSKANCADCHTSQSARDRCTTCHHYHVR